MNFTPEEAAHFLGLSLGFSAEDVQNSEEDMVFPLRDFFLRNPPAEALWNARIRKLTTIAQAAEVLVGAYPEMKLDKELGNPSSVADLLRGHDEMLAAMRTLISSGCKAAHVLSGAKKILELESEYNQRFLDLTVKHSGHPELSNPLTRIDAPLVLSMLQTGDAEKAASFIAAERKRIEDSLSSKIKK